MREFIYLMIWPIFLTCSCKKPGEASNHYPHQENTSSFNGAASDPPEQGFSVTGNKESNRKDGFTSEASSRFFGNSDGGDLIAFVLDFSGSMKGVRENILKKELAKSLGSLESDVNFSVIIFNHTGWFLGDRNGWLKAIPQNIKKSIELVKNQHADGGTDWSSGLKLAFSLKPHPEVIYFMTDGQTDINSVVSEWSGSSTPGSVVDYVTRQNQSKFPPARIHATALMQVGLNQDLINLAKKNGGEFTWVDAQGNPTKQN